MPANNFGGCGMAWTEAPKARFSKKFDSGGENIGQCQGNQWLTTTKSDFGKSQRVQPWMAWTEAPKVRFSKKFDTSGENIGLCKGNQWLHTTKSDFGKRQRVQPWGKVRGWPKRFEISVFDFCQTMLKSMTFP